MYHHVKKLMYSVSVGSQIRGSGKCSWNSLAERTESSPPRCNIQLIPPARNRKLYSSIVALVTSSVS